MLFRRNCLSASFAMELSGDFCVGNLFPKLPLVFVLSPSSQYIYIIVVIGIMMNTYSNIRMVKCEWCLADYSTVVVMAAEVWLLLWWCLAVCSHRLLACAWLVVMGSEKIHGLSLWSKRCTSFKPKEISSTFDICLKCHTLAWDPVTFSGLERVILILSMRIMVIWDIGPLNICPWWSLKIFISHILF